MAMRLTIGKLRNVVRTSPGKRVRVVGSDGKKSVFVSISSSNRLVALVKHGIRYYINSTANQEFEGFRHLPAQSAV